MSTMLTISLTDLRCNSEADHSGGSEPYVWPVLLWIDDDTVRQPEIVGMTAPRNDPNAGLWRLVIKSNMRAGETAGIPSSVGVLRALLSDNTTFRFMVIVLVLWEEDDTPDDAVRAGFLVFPNEVRAAVADNLAALIAAIGTGDGTQLTALEAAIKDRVSAAVKAAISDKVSLADIALGGFNPDDLIGSDFVVQDIGKIAPEENTPFTAAFTLAVSEASDNYEVQGEMQLRRVPVDPVDPCATQVSAVVGAQSVVDAINVKIEILQARLQNASTVDKPGINNKINEENDKLAAATDKLEAAQRALQTCRST